MSYLWLLIFVLPIAVQTARFALKDTPAGFRSANWDSTGILPNAALDPEARVVVFAGRSGRWRSIFADHTWIAVKPKNGRYTRYEVTGFGEPVRTNWLAPDAYWYSNYPVVVADIRGEIAEKAIPKIVDAVRSYAFAEYGDYRVWPGPNSNTFVATLLRAAPELGVALPPTAIGKDFRADYSVFGLTPSGTGFEVALYGLLGLKAGWVEGLELNFLTLVAGVDIRNPALKLPGIGRIDIPGFTTHAVAR
jgi:hypothetical protein